ARRAGDAARAAEHARSVLPVARGRVPPAGGGHRRERETSLQLVGREVPLMSTSVKMPQLGETVIEGTILKWLKKEGESIDVDEPLFEISTDKVDTEVPSLAGAWGAGASNEAAPATGASSSVGTTSRRSPSGGPRSQILSPVVRKLAEENSVDLSRVQGTGTGGRITRNDVLNYLDGGTAAPAAPSRTPPAPQAPAPTPAPAPQIAAAGEREEIVPVSHIRKAIATHMKQSLETSARAWNM